MTRTVTPVSYTHLGRLYGRGSVDDKGPVVASLFALKAIRDLGSPLNRRVRLLFGLNEETNDRDVLYLSLIHICRES